MAVQDETTERGKSIYEEGNADECNKQEICGSTRINCTSAWYLKESKYKPRYGNNFTPYLGGEDLFAAIAESIKGATSSVDIITMGFDPAMPLVRTSSTYGETTGGKSGALWWKKEHRYSPWRKDDAYGQIMFDALEAQQDLRIRLLLWKHTIGLANAVTGIAPTVAERAISYKSSRETGFDAKKFGDTKKDQIENLQLRQRNPEASQYSSDWFHKVCWEDFPGADRLGVVFRHMPSITLKEEEALVGAEGITFMFASHHQKVILVDYDIPEKRHAYISGLNGQTNYWSAFPFVHRDVRSEMDWCPYHDFGIRIEGPLLEDLNENFCTPWDANCSSNALSSSQVRYNPQKDPNARASVLDFEQSRNAPKVPPKRAIYSQPLAGERKVHNDSLDKEDQAGSCKKGTGGGQIVRTHPDKRLGEKPSGEEASVDEASVEGKYQEKEIKEGYLQAARLIRQYMLIVNQYCQYPKLFAHLKHWRLEYAKKQKELCGDNNRIFILMGTCKPERPGMVFRSHQMANELGLGNQFSAADATLYEPDGSKTAEESTKTEESNSDEIELESLKDIISEEAQLDLQAELNLHTGHGTLQFLEEGEGSDTGAEVGEGDATAATEEEPVPSDMSNTEALELNPEESMPSGYKTSSRGERFSARDKVTLEQVQKMGIYPLFFSFYTQIPTPPSPSEDGEPPAVDSMDLINTVAQQVYVHGKLMVEDDAFFTLGSANLNIRSLAVDSELNLISDDCATARNYRKKLLDVYSGIEMPDEEKFPNFDGDLNDIMWYRIYKELTDLTQDNSECMDANPPERIQGYIAWFEDSRKITGLTNIRVG